MKKAYLYFTEHEVSKWLRYYVVSTVFLKAETPFLISKEYILTQQRFLDSASCFV